MNEEIEIVTVSETLSDGSKVWNVMIHQRGMGSSPICVDCVSEKGAIKLASTLRDLFTEGGAA